ncbi:unnamed protein product [Closterium sp. NIES-53]
MQDLCPLRTPSAWRLLPVARPGHASVSACHTPRACIGFCTSHALGVRRFVPIACPRHALVFCSSHALGVWRFLHVTNPGRVVVSARRTPQACSRERYFLLVVDDYTCYTTVFPLRSKDEVPDILIPWIRAVRLQLREQFRLDLLVLCLHSDRGGEFSSDLLRDFCRGEGILQSFTLPASPQQNGIAERRIGLVMEVAPTSMIHVAAPHFLWLFVVRYTAHQLNLCVGRERLAMCRCSGSGVLVPLFAIRPRTSSPPILFPASSLAFPLTRLAGSFTTPPRAVSSPLKTSHPLPGIVPVEVAIDSGAARGAASGGASSGGAEPGGAEPGDAESDGAGSRGAECGGAHPGGAESAGVESGGAEPAGAESGGAEPQGTASSGGPAGASPRLSPRPEPLSSQKLREWFTQRTRLRSGAAGAGDSAAGDTGAGGAGVTARAGGVGGAGFGDPTEPGAAGAGGAGARGTGAGGAGAVGAGAGGTGVGGAVVRGAGAVDPGDGGARGTVRLRPYFLPLLQQVLGVPSSFGLPPRLLCAPPDQSQPPLQPASPLPAPSPYTEQTGGLTERRKPMSYPASPVRNGRRIPRPHPPPVLGTHAMALRPSSVSLRVSLRPPPESSLPEVPDPESDRARAAIVELLDFAAACRLDYATALVAESESASPSTVEGECALGTDVLEDRQEDFECLAAAAPCFASMLHAPEGDPDAPDVKH